MLALVQCYFIQKTGKKLTHAQLEKFVKDNCKDIGEKCGYGIFVLPATQNIEIRRYTDEEEEDMQRYNTIDEVPDWGKATIEKLMKKNVLQGDENGNLNLSSDLLRTFVIHDRLKLYD